MEDIVDVLDVITDEEESDVNTAPRCRKFTFIGILTVMFACGIYLQADAITGKQCDHAFNAYYLYCCISL